MDEIEQYQARIYAALDKIARISSDTASASSAQHSDDEGLRQRDLELIEELEATIAEERADLDSERNATAALKGKLVEAERALEQATAAQQDGDAAKTDLENALKDSETARAEAKAALSAAETAAKETAADLQAASTARQEAEQCLQHAHTDC